MEPFTQALGDPRGFRYDVGIYDKTEVRKQVTSLSKELQTRALTWEAEIERIEEASSSQRERS